MKILRSKHGLTVLYQHFDSDLVDIRFYIGCGAIDEKDPAEYGLCHALEHILFAGTKSRSWLDITRAWGSVGAHSNAFTSFDKTVYLASSLKTHWQETFEVLADVVYNPTFPKDRWEQVEKQAILSEIQGFQDDELRRLDELIHAHALGSNFHTVDGNAVDIEKTTVEDLHNIYNKFYQNNNIILIISGDLTESQILKAVNKYTFDKGDNAPKRERVSFEFNFSPIKIHVPEMEQVLIDALKPIPYPSTLRSQIALKVGTHCLQEYLFEELREKRGLCYMVSATERMDIPNNCFMKIETATDRERLPRMRRAFREAMEKFIDEGLTKERVAHIKARDQMSVTADSENIMASADFVWEAWENQIYSDPFRATKDIISALDAGTIRRAMRKALDGKFKLATMTTTED